MTLNSRSALDARIAAAVDELDSHLLALSCVASPEARKTGMTRILERHLVDADRAERIRRLATYVDAELGDTILRPRLLCAVNELLVLITQYLDGVDCPISHS